MHSVTFLLLKSVAYLIFCGITCFLLVGGFHAFRLLRVPVDWATWTIGSFFILASTLTTIFLFVPQLAPSPYGRLKYFASLVEEDNNTLGNLAVVLTFCAFSQWATSQSYRVLKTRTLDFLIRQVRQFLLFVRKHHQFFGWLVLTTATAHAISYAPNLNSINPIHLITGLVVWLILLFLCGLGQWMQWRRQIKKVSIKGPHLLHIVTALLFVATLLVHS